MIVSRRKFVGFAGGSIIAERLASFAGVLGAESALKSHIKAIVFDGFVIFDPKPVFALAESFFPGVGASFSNEWRTRQFEYTWLRIAARQYADFWQVTRDALVFAAKKLSIELTSEKLDKLMNAYLELDVWPDVITAIKSLKNSGLQLGFLSNFTANMLDKNVRHSRLEGIFAHILSTDRAKTYKPDPLAYQLAVDSFRLKREEILFAAFGGWDAVGAKLFGYPTFWVNRQKLPLEQLGAVPDGSGETLSQLVQALV
jgi:2-haloacid dehalogenase